MTVDPSLFAEHMEALRELSIDVIPFGEVPDALAARRSAVAISIDDGLADAAENACPTLARLGMTATLFVPTGYVGGRSGWLRGEDAQRPMLSWATLVSLAQQGFEIASHGQMHIAADLNAPELVERDARASRVELEDRIGRAVSSFAYPFGYHSALRPPCEYAPPAIGRLAPSAICPLAPATTAGRCRACRSGTTRRRRHWWRW